MIVAQLIPPSEHVHWWFASGFVLVTLCLLTRAVVGPEVWDRRPWRRYLCPSLVLLAGLCMFPVMVLFANSTVHMLAHGAWAEVGVLAGCATLGLAAGKLQHPLWNLTVPIMLLVTGVGLLVHEQNSWLYSRSAFDHHLSGWLLIAGSIFPLVLTFRPRSTAAGVGFALVILAFSVILYTNRDTAPIFGHLSPEAGIPHR